MSDVFHEEEALGNVYDTRLIRRLWEYVAPYRWQIALTLAMVVPLFFLELAPGWVIKTGLDRAYGGIAGGSAAEPLAVDRYLGFILEAPEGWADTVWLAGLYLIIAIAGSAMNYAHMILMATTGQSAMRDLRRVVFARIQTLHLGFFDRYPVGRVVTRTTNDVESVSEMFAAGVVALITDLFRMAGIIVALFMVDADLAIWVVMVVPFLAVAAVMFRLKVREAFRAVRVRIARINAHIQETISGMKVVQLFTREARNMRDFDAMNADHRDAWKQSIRYDALLFAVVEAASGITVAIIIWKGTGVAEPGVLFIFIDWTRRFFRPLMDLSAKYSVMQSSMASAERIFQLLDSEVEIPDPEDAVAPPPGEGSVEFQNVWFAYQGEDWVLRDLSFKVEPGEKVAFVGATGAGKTTIINLLSRFYEVSRGSILVDGVDIREFPQSELRRRIATVLQDVFLFSGTVRENIALGRTDLDLAAVERAARAVEAHDFITRLPGGYETEVRERGSNFSAGQRQLLSFARALAHGASVLVLDEATSSIDTETEAMIQRGIRTLMEGKTAIAIAHRLSTIRDVDRIYVLHRGELVESGHHDQLVSQGGVYQRLYQLQAELDEVVAVG